MDIYDAVKLVAEGLKLAPNTGDAWSSPRVPNPALIKETLSTTPAICANIATAIDLGICIDAYCSNQSKHGTVNPKVDLQRFHDTLQQTLRTSHMRQFQPQAVIGKILNTYKDQLCKDQPPPPTATAPVLAASRAPVDLPDESPVRTGDCGYVVSVAPEVRTGWIVALGGFLGILAIRSFQAVTGSLFLFFMPEKQDSLQNGA